MASKKILHVTEAFAGGVFEVIKNICDIYKSDSEIEMEVAYQDKPETPSNLKALFDGNAVLRQICLSREIAPIKDIKSFFALVKLFREVKPDIVHLHSSKAGFLGRIAAFVCGVKSCYSPHGYAFTRPDVGDMKRKFFYFLERIGGWFRAVTIACGEEEYVWAKRFGKAFLVKNGVRCDRPAYPRNRELLGRIRIGTVGRIVPAKGVDMFLAVTNALKIENVDWLWIGGGEEEEKLVKNKINFTGWVTKKEVEDHLGRLDIYIQTSLQEGLSLAVLEAMSFAKPIVATNISGIRESVVDGSTGFLASDVSEFAQHLRHLIDNPGLRQQIGLKARERAEVEFNLVTNYSKLKQIYLNLLD